MRANPFVSCSLGLVLITMIGCQAPPSSTTTSPSVAESKPGHSVTPASTPADADRSGLSGPAPEAIEVREETYDSGQVSQRSEGYVGPNGDFVRHGVTRTWYEDGSKKSEISYAHGTMHGLRLTWYPTGQMWGRGTYEHGKEHGTWTAWWANGFKQREWQMDHGVWHGPYMEWHDNGEKKMEFEYVNGLKQGTLRIWDPQGILVHESEYVDDIEQPK